MFLRDEWQDVGDGGEVTVGRGVDELLRGEIGSSDRGILLGWVGCFGGEGIEDHGEGKDDWVVLQK